MLLPSIFTFLFFQQQVARNQSLRREKSDVVVVSVQDGKITDAKNSFMQSMMTSSSSSSSSRLGTSILPTGLDGQVRMSQERSDGWMEQVSTDLDGSGLEKGGKFRICLNYPKLAILNRYPKVFWPKLNFV